MPLYKDIYNTLSFRLPVVATDPIALLEITRDDIPKHWICGDWTTGCAVNGHKKPKGCAIGLLAINAGMATFSVEKAYTGTVDEKGNDIYEDLVYAHFSGDRLVENEHIAEAALCLVHAIPAINLYTLERAEADPKVAQDIVIDHNDNSGMNPTEAYKWFDTALNIARERAAKHTAELTPVHS